MIIIAVYVGETVSGGTSTISNYFNEVKEKPKMIVYQFQKCPHVIRCFLFLSQ